MGVNNAGIALIGLVNDGRGGGATQMRGYFKTNGFEGAIDNAGGDRIDRGMGVQRRPPGNQAAV